MGKRTDYPAGTFSWVDLATTDPDGAKSFYGALFGWDAEDMAAGGAGTYTMLRLGGDDVAGLYRQGDDQRDAGIPPNWLSYVTVDDVTETTGRARELGATVVGEPLEVMDVGRMAVIQDATGATVALWEPRRHIGAGRVNDPGCLCWNDLVTSDPDGAEQFYAPLFGWEIEQLEGAGGYRIVRNAGRSNGGIMPVALLGGGPGEYWLPYFNAGDLEAATARIDGGGGHLLAGPHQIPAGRIAVAQDPQGAVFALFEGDVDD